MLSHNDSPHRALEKQGHKTGIKGIKPKTAVKRGFPALKNIPFSSDRSDILLLQKERQNT
jgi:hypothetical protein